MRDGPMDVTTRAVAPDRWDALETAFRAEVFERERFVEVVRRRPERPVMR